MNTNQLRILRAQVTRFMTMAARFRFWGRPLDAKEAQKMADRFHRLLNLVRSTFTLLPWNPERAA